MFLYSFVACSLYLTPQNHPNTLQNIVPQKYNPPPPSTHPKMLTPPKKNNKNKPKLNLSLNPDILEYISNRKNNRPKLVIGFAAETDNLIKNAKEKLSKKNCDWILANDISKNPEIFGGDNNTISLITKNSVDNWNTYSKKEVAEKLVNKVIENI